MTAPKAAGKTESTPEIEAAGGKKPRGLRRLVAGALLSLAVVAALVAGGWGLLADSVPQTAALAAARGAVAQGEAAEVPGGLLRVDDVIPEHMAPMQMGKFEQSGMDMSGMGMDMAPEGQQRFTVEISLAAGNGGLDYSAGDFQLIGEGIEKPAPIRTQLGDGDLPAGSQTSGSLIFQAPEDAGGLTLSFKGGEPVALDLGNEGGAGDKGASGGGHDH